MILQSRNSNGKLVKKDSTSSMRCPLPPKRFSSVRSNLQETKPNLKVLSEIQEREPSCSEELKMQPSAIKDVDIPNVSIDLFLNYTFEEIIKMSNIIIFYKIFYPFIVIFTFICTYKSSSSAAETILFLKTDTASEIVVIRIKRK